MSDSDVANLRLECLKQAVFLSRLDEPAGPNEVLAVADAMFRYVSSGRNPENPEKTTRTQSAS